MAQPLEGVPDRFPSALLAALRAEVAEGGLWRLGLWNGETVTLSRIVRETEDGLIGEVQAAAGADVDRPGLVAVPWQAVARVEALPSAARRARPGFHPGT